MAVATAAAPRTRFRRIGVRQVGPCFAAEVSGVDIAGGVDDATFAEIVDALNEFSVLIFPGQTIDDARQIAFSERFGPLEVSIRKDRPRPDLRPEVSDISNTDEHGELLKPDDERRAYNIGNMLWHSDSSFKQVPAMASLLSGRIVPPEGGDTEFCDLRAAYDDLPESTRRLIDGLVAEHSLIYSRSLTGYTQFTEAERQALPPVRQALVRTHPGSGRKSLYLGSHASHIVGWPLEKGRALLIELTALATRARYMHAHQWRQGDLVMWDNRCVLHRALPFESLRYKRVMRRTTVAGAGPTA